MTRSVLIAVCSLLFAPGAFSSELPGPDDTGWHSWRVPAVPDAPAWCCGHWNRGVASASECKLDSTDGNHVDDDARFQEDPLEMQIYVRLQDKQAADIRVYDARCPVQGTIVDHGSVSPDASVRWLGKHAADDARTGLLMAIAAHDGRLAATTLERYSRPGPALATRKEALFWIARLRGDESSDALFDALRRENDAAIREHAVFAISQLKGAAATKGLLDIIEDRSLTQDVREQALFWLAQSDSPDAWAYIDRLLTH